MRPYTGISHVYWKHFFGILHVTVQDGGGGVKMAHYDWTRGGEGNTTIH